MNLGSFHQSPQSSSMNPSDDSKRAGAQLLELRTAAGAVYVCPSPWQRVRLQWAFRHFRVLPLQVFSRRDQRLIEKLSRSAVVARAFPLTGSTVLGVVENLVPTPAPPAARVVTMQPYSTVAKRLRTRQWPPALLSPDFSHGRSEQEIREQFGAAQSRGVRDIPFRQWGALGVLAAACFTLIVASFYGAMPLSNTAPVSDARSLPAQAQASRTAQQPLVIPRAPALPPASAKPRHQAAPTAQTGPPENELASLERENYRRPGVSSARVSLIPASATVADTIVERKPIVPAITAVPLIVSQLPQGHFAHPVALERNQVGELQLKALIGADGLVKNVTLVSGNPRLAQVAMRAVRHWHYTPYRVLGSPVEVETRIRMNFFGEDAVSVASGPPPISRVASIVSKPND